MLVVFLSSVFIDIIIRIKAHSVTQFVGYYQTKVAAYYDNQLLTVITVHLSLSQRSRNVVHVAVALCGAEMLYMWQ